MTSDPAYASVGPGDVIVDFVPATVLQYVLHNLLHAFGIAGCTTSRNRQTLLARNPQSEQPSRFLGYPTFVTTRDVPNPQTEVRRVGREAQARFAFRSASAAARVPPADRKPIAVMANTAVQNCRARSDWFSVSPANGRKPCIVPEIAIAERMKTPVAVSCSVKRKAVQITIGREMNAIG